MTVASLIGRDRTTFGLFESGKLRPVIDGPYELTDIADAFRLFGAVKHKGKIIVTMA